MGDEKDETARDLNPREAEKAIKDAQYEDCLPCKAVGSITMLGLGGWNYYAGMRNLRAQEREILKSGSRFGMRPRRFGVVTISVALAGMGVWRALN